ncbi:NUDIX hydrolase [Myceligenerans salitolerans]|uniref:NUDIX hydrolase n=1 Tax=Myceligenerans salitolerans TaxID=1230528 RepID=A0ABS3I5L2_9MICO|nr:NUDIX hydrolase [Myceligenerans salitolerans]MBO0608292.1 NUDIX hydrolase [Myceligenerans salitolerans]
MNTIPALPRAAATVILVRDLPDPSGERSPLQVFLQRRVPTMAFAAGMTVFPGGAVDPGDAVVPARIQGPAPEEWGRRFSCPPGEAAGFVGAAVRETFEECGVLLAGPSGPGSPLPDDAWLRAARSGLVDRTRTLADVLDGAGLALRADLLHPWSRWITPEQEPRRYDAAFFVAVLPAGQAADARTTEAVEARWWYPADVLAAHASGAARLMPPTFLTLTEIAALPDTAALTAAAAGNAERAAEPIRPALVRRGDRTVAVVGGREIAMP